MRISGFLADVRNELLKQNKLRVRCIRVAADGSWRPVVETDRRLVDDDHASEDEYQGRKNRWRPKKESKETTDSIVPAVEVIELSDSD